MNAGGCFDFAQFEPLRRILAAINDCHIIGGKNNFESLFTLNIENVAR